MSTSKIAIYTIIALIAYRAMNRKTTTNTSTSAYPYEQTASSFKLPPDLK